MLVNRQVLLAGLETTYNTPATLTPANNAVLVENIALAFEGLRMAERNPTRPSLAMVQKVYGGALMTVTFDVEIKGSGALGTAPELGVLLQACGFVETVNAGDSVVYTPTSTAANQKSVTLDIYQDGILFQLSGCRGTVTGNLTTGEVGKLSFTLSGHYTRTGSQSPTDAALPPDPSYVSALPPPVIGASLVLGGFSNPVAADVTFDMGLQVSKPADISKPDGFGTVQITKRAVTGTVNPEAVTVATADFYGQLRTNQLLNISTGLIGPAVTGYTITFPKAQITEIAQGDREGIRTFDLSFAAVDGLEDETTDNDIEIRFGNPTP